MLADLYFKKLMSRALTYVRRVDPIVIELWDLLYHGCSIIQCPGFTFVGASTQNALA